ncbi:YsnF/AvaK domain-containing protein [Peribacillus sp. SCS-155]|uniref:YsnF/AvaK domain-containing protein n=1 Tax=Peribacillus sedimenti TaxID=3115297 RepID=UPI003906A042
MDKTVYGVYNSSPEVIQAINSLKAKGFDSDDITVIADNEETLNLRGAARDVNTVTNNTDHDDSFMDKVMRFFMNDGTYGLQDRLTAAGLSDAEAAEYVNDVEAGRIVVLVDQSAAGIDTQDTLYTDTNDTLNRGTAGLTNNPDPNVFPDTLATTGSPEFSDSLGTARRDRDRDLTAEERTMRGNWNSELTEEDRTIRGNLNRDLDDEERTIRLREEQLEVNKEEVSAGEVVLNKEVTEEVKTVNVPVEREELYVERRPVTEGTDDLNAGPITDGESIRIPLTEERVEVTKRPVVTEEVIIGKRTVQETQQVQDTVKKEDVEISEDGRALLDGDRRTRMDLNDADNSIRADKRYIDNKIDTDKL